MSASISPRVSKNMLYIENLSFRVQGRTINILDANLYYWTMHVKGKLARCAVLKGYPEDRVHLFLHSFQFGDTRLCLLP